MAMLVPIQLISGTTSLLEVLPEMTVGDLKEASKAGKRSCETLSNRRCIEWVSIGILHPSAKKSVTRLRFQDCFLHVRYVSYY